MLLKRGFLFGEASRMNGKRGQVWVETVIYTLIAFALMGLVLAFVVPKIEETQDKGIIEQSVGVLQDIDSLIRNLGGPGNQRTPEIGLNKGSLTIDGINDTIFFTIESKYQYSQPGEAINIGKIVVNTEEQGEDNIVTLTLDYSGQYNLTHEDKEEEKVLTRAPTPYRVLISNKGVDGAGNSLINLEVVG